MEAYKRIKYLRKTILDLSQDKFSKKINISRSNLGNIENGKVKLTERVLSDICRNFHVNQNWLLNGIKPIFEENITPSNSLDFEILKLYSSLTNENKKYLYGYIQRLLEEQQES